PDCRRLITQTKSKPAWRALFTHSGHGPLEFGRLEGLVMPTCWLKPRDQTAPIEVLVERRSNPNSYSIQFAERSFDVTLESDGPNHGWLREGSRVFPFFITRKNGCLQVWIDGRAHSFEIVERTAQRTAGTASAAHRDDLPAPMPGTILRINV